MDASSDRATLVASACVPYGVSVTSRGALVGKAPLASAAVSPGLTVLLRALGSFAINAFLVATSQPRTSTPLAWSAVVSTARNATVFSPNSSTCGSFAIFGAGALLAGLSLTNSSRPASSTLTTASCSWASICRKSQSDTPAWLRCW